MDGTVVPKYRAKKRMDGSVVPTCRAKNRMDGKADLYS